MKKLILGLFLAAFAFSPALLAGEGKKAHKAKVSSETKASACGGSACSAKADACGAKQTAGKAKSRHLKGGALLVQR